MIRFFTTTLDRSLAGRQAAAAAMTAAISAGPGLRQGETQVSVTETGVDVITSSDAVADAVTDLLWTGVLGLFDEHNHDRVENFA